MPDTVPADRVRPTLQLNGPLAGAGPIALPGRLSVVPAPDTARLLLRGDPGALGAAFGLTLPLEPCRTRAAGERTALWLGPDEWLLLAPPGTLMEQAVEGGAVVDISHRQVGLTLDGPGAADALAAGCPLDLHHSAFPPGMCTRTVFGKAEIVVWRQEAERWHVEVWRSFASYVHGLLTVAAASI